MKLVLNSIEDIELYLDTAKHLFKNKKVFVKIEENKESSWYRKQYFAILGDLSKNSGFDKNAIHLMLKEKILPEILNNSDYLKKDCDSDDDSTKCLNDSGWEEYNSRAKELIFNNLEKIYE